VPDGLRVLIRRSKTDQEGAGQEIAIPRGYRLRLVQDTEPGETFADLGGGHRGTVVTHRRTWQATTLDRLRQTMRHVLTGFRQIPLQMAGQPRSVIENAE